MRVVSAKARSSQCRPEISSISRRINSSLHRTRSSHRSSSSVELPGRYKDSNSAVRVLSRATRARLRRSHAAKIRCLVRSRAARIRRCDRFTSTAAATLVDASTTARRWSTCSPSGRLAKMDLLANTTHRSRTDRAGDGCRRFQPSSGEIRVRPWSAHESAEQCAPRCALSRTMTEQIDSPVSGDLWIAVPHDAETR